MKRARCRIGLYGGSFDPIHVGHVRPVQRARQTLSLERVIYLPTARPPHKTDREMAPSHARYAMVELALLGEAGLFASPFEMDDSSPSYTVDTLAHFRRELPHVDLVLLIGSDSLAELTTWRAWNWIVGSTEIAVLSRPGQDDDALFATLPPALDKAFQAGRLHRVANPPLDISSTELRQRLAAGESPPPSVLAPQVLDYIRKYELYDDPIPPETPRAEAS